MNLLHKNFIVSFIEEVSTLNGTEFEFLCVPVLALILDKTIEHKGHNPKGKPVGYTADLLSIEDGVIGQCGTEPNYFNDLDKPIKDIESAIKNHPNSKTIYLFANQRCTGRNLTSLKTRIKSEKHIKAKIKIYDSEKIAKRVLKSIGISSKIDYVLEFLPKTKEFFKILPESNKLPALNLDYINRDEEQEIVNLLSNLNYIQIYGISGIGKSEISKAIAGIIRKEYDTIVWLDGEVLAKNNCGLSSVQILKFNSNINIEFLLHHSKCLLIIDNLNENINEFLNNFQRANRKESKCIITSLQKNVSQSNSYHLKYLNKKKALRILYNINPQPTSRIRDIIIESIKGYPLVLRLIKSSIENGDLTWNQIAGEINELKNLEDESNIKLSQRIIGKFIKNLAEELSVIKVLNKTKISYHYLLFTLKNIGVNNLIKRGLIDRQNSYYFSIHQLILDAINSLVSINNENKWNRKLENYLFYNNDIKSIDFFNFLLNHQEYVLSVYKKLNTEDRLKKVILYSIMQSSDFYSNPTWVIKELNEIKIDPRSSYQDLLLYIDKEEIKLYQLKGKENYKKECEEIIKSLKALLTSVSDNKSKLFLLHHIGKFYSKINSSNEAENYFLQVINIDAEADYARLQLARIYLKTNQTESAKNEINLALDGEINMSNQSLSILLAFFELLSNRKLVDLRDKYIINNESFFLSVLLHSLNSNFDQPYRVLEKLSGHLSYNAPNLYKEIMDILPYPSNIDANNRLKIAYAIINLGHFKYLKYTQTEDEKLNNEKKEKAYELAESFFQSAELKTDINKRRLIDLYIQKGENQKALNELSNLKNNSDPYVLQTKCKVFKINEKYKDALASINLAISTKERIAEYQKAAFLNDKAEVQRLIGNHNNSLQSLKEAISLQTNQKTKNAWIKKYELWDSENK